jgi:DNA-nicking Smr family endonuclease
MLRKMRREPALERLSTFVRHHRHVGTPRVVIVVGRGRQSGDGGPVIGPAVRQWCDRHPDLVLDVHVAPPSQGGDGALVLHLVDGD